VSPVDTALFHGKAGEIQMPFPVSFFICLVDSLTQRHGILTAAMLIVPLIIDRPIVVVMKHLPFGL
jgi:hypothetical protein